MRSTLKTSCAPQFPSTLKIYIALQGSFYPNRKLLIAAILSTFMKILMEALSGIRERVELASYHTPGTTVNTQQDKGQLHLVLESSERYPLFLWRLKHLGCIALINGFMKTFSLHSLTLLPNLCFRHVFSPLIKKIKGQRQAVVLFVIDLVWSRSRARVWLFSVHFLWPLKCHKYSQFNKENCGTGLQFSFLIFLDFMWLWCFPRREDVCSWDWEKEVSEPETLTVLLPKPQFEP